MGMAPSRAPDTQSQMMKTMTKALSICFGSFDANEIETDDVGNEQEAEAEAAAENDADAEEDDAEGDAEEDDAEGDAEDTPARTINCAMPDDDEYDEGLVPFPLDPLDPLDKFMAIVDKDGRLVICKNVDKTDDDDEDGDDDGDDGDNEDDDDALARSSYWPALAADCTSCADRPGAEARCMCASA